MEKEFVPYELAVKLKTLGYDEPCLCSWNFYTNELNFNGQPSTFSSEDVIQLPTFSQAFRWFRENHNLRGFIGFRPNIKQFDCHVYDMSLSGKEYTEQRTMEEFNKDPKVGTYEEAELACIEKLIEIVENK